VINERRGGPGPLILVDVGRVAPPVKVVKTSVREGITGRV